MAPEWNIEGQIMRSCALVLRDSTTLLYSRARDPGGRAMFWAALTGRARWLRIAAARRRGTLLPPVDLIQVGQRYFVQDGHHRISVARALGQQGIEARLTAWYVSGPLPWEDRAKPSERLEPKMLARQLYGKILAQVRTRTSDHRDRAAHAGV